MLLCLISSSFQQQEDEVQQQLTSLDGAETSNDSDPPSLNEIKEKVTEQMIPYSFAYDTGLSQGVQLTRKESGDSSGVRGSYSYVDADGLFRTVEYIADKDGFRATIKTNEPGINNAEMPRPASVTIHGEESPEVVVNRMHNRATVTSPAPAVTPPSLFSSSSSTSTSQPRTQKVPASQFVLFEPSRPNLNKIADLNAGAKMFRLIPMASGDGKSVPRPSNIVVLLPEQDFNENEPVQQEEQEITQEQDNDERIAQPSSTTTTTTTTTPRPTTRASKIFQKIASKTRIVSKVSTSKNIARFPTKTSPVASSSRLPSKTGTKTALTITRKSATNVRSRVKGATIEEQASAIMSAILSPARTLRTGNLKNM